MKLLIDIPNEAYNRLLAEQHLPNRLDIEYFIVHGKPFDELITEIKTDLKNATDQAETSQEDIDCGIEIGLQMAIDVVNKLWRRRRRHNSRVPLYELRGKNNLSHFNR